MNLKNVTEENRRMFGQKRTRRNAPAQEACALVCIQLIRLSQKNIQLISSINITDGKSLCMYIQENNYSAFL